jgi:hypothetical protein
MGNAKILRKGLHFCSTIERASMVAYLDPLVSGTVLADTYGLTAASGNDIFAAGGRDGIVRSLYIGPTGTTGFPQVLLLGRVTGDILAIFRAPQFSGATFTFGPEGLLAPDGFKVRIVGGGDVVSFTLAYEVV